MKKYFFILFSIFIIFIVWMRSSRKAWEKRKERIIELRIKQNPSHDEIKERMTLEMNYEEDMRWWYRSGGTTTCYKK